MIPLFQSSSTATNTWPFMLWLSFQCNVHRTVVYVKCWEAAASGFCLAFFLLFVPLPGTCHPFCNIRLMFIFFGQRPWLMESYDHFLGDPSQSGFVYMVAYGMRIKADYLALTRCHCKPLIFTGLITTTCVTIILV